ncbi:MAG: hypothetical protein J5I52_00635 [Saprospiraceae bacterium]|nr:MAG: hypothetical protein UZ09_BCD002000791 [Bacteroidetes bacterium OLB9]MCO6462630.1 hypothetical protein [Saprospiraceae bacterium]
MQNKYQFELLSVLFAMVFSALFMLPIYLKSGDHYNFYISNTINIILFITLTRWIFMLRYSPFSRSKWIRFALVFIPIPLLMYQMDRFYEFRFFVDDIGVLSFFGNEQTIENFHFGRFIKYQYFFFSTGAMVTTVLLPVRMIISFWRTYNTEDKV